MQTLVVYYSNTGSNKYLAEKIAAVLSCDNEAIKPRLNFFPCRQERSIRICHRLQQG